MRQVKSLLVAMIFLSVAIFPACTPSFMTQRCMQMAKLACDVSAAIPAVGSVVSPMCELFTSSATVQELCSKAGTKVADFMSPLGSWLDKHGLSGLATLKPMPIQAKPLLDGGVPQK